MKSRTSLSTFSARQVFDRSSAVVLLAIASPLIILVAIRARISYGRVFDREPVLGTYGQPVELKRFAGFHAGRNLALLANIAAGHIAWVGSKPIKLTSDGMPAACPMPLSKQRPGLICRKRLQKLTGTCYELENAPPSVVSDESDMGLIASLSLLSRYFLAKLMAPEYAARQPSQLSMLGVTIDNVSIQGALDMIAQRVETRTSSMLAFVNPDCLNKAVKDPDYAKTLESMDAVFADGIGLQIGCRMLGYQLKANVNGTDLFPLLCDQAARRHHSIYLLGGQPDVAHQAAERMQKQFPQLRIAGTQHGFFNSDETADIKAAINASRADILLVAFGAPRQEAWLEEHSESLDVPVGIGVGGLFDFYSGRISRSPRWLRDIGMEWSWRLLQEPGRMWRRYILGNSLFLFRVWRQSKQESGKRIVQRFSGNNLDLHRARLNSTLSHATHTVLLLLGIAARRLLDVVVATGAILALSPLLIGVAICIKRESPGPVFFCQQRVGKWGEYFTMYKFRSMCVDADGMKQSLANENQMDGGVLFKVKSDPRMTRTGRFIRKYSIDELPQLWNVIKGDMALVGPRPPVKSEVDQYCLSDRRRLEIKPGITCLWQVSGRSEIPFKEQVELDVEYIESHGFWQDMKILLRTVPAVLLGKGAY